MGASGERPASARTLAGSLDVTHARPPVICKSRPAPHHYSKGPKLVVCALTGVASMRCMLYSQLWYPQAVGCIRLHLLCLPLCFAAALTPAACCSIGCSIRLTQLCLPASQLLSGWELQLFSAHTVAGIGIMAPLLRRLLRLCCCRRPLPPAATLPPPATPAVTAARLQLRQRLL